MLHKRALLVAFIAWSSIGLIAGSATCLAQSPIGSADQLGTPSKDTAATPVVIVDAKKCEDKAPPEPNAWSEPERWAWQQICKHLNVDFDEREANRIADEQAGGDSPKHEEIYKRHLEKLHQLHRDNPEKLAIDEKRTLSGKFLAMIFGDGDLRYHTWNVPLKFFGFNTDQFVIDTATLNSLDIQYAYVPRFLIKSTTLQGYLGIEHTHSGRIALKIVTAKSFVLNDVSVIAKNSRLNHPRPDEAPLDASERDGALEVDTARIEDRLSILEGHYDAIELKHVKVDGLFIDRPTWNNPGGSDPELSISESVDNGTFRFQTNADGVRRVRLSQFIFANAYLGADPMPVIRAMEADTRIRTRADDTSVRTMADDTIDRPDLEPFTLIAKAYGQRGETSISDAILIAKNDQDWHLAHILSWDFLRLSFTWLLADYGFHPEFGFLWIGGFVLVGWAAFWYGSGRLAEDSYRPKSPFLLALDSVIPGIHLDKNHEEVRYSGWPQIMLYLLRILGAVLFFVALGYLQKRLLG